MASSTDHAVAVTRGRRRFGEMAMAQLASHPMVHPFPELYSENNISVKSTWVQV